MPDTKNNRKSMVTVKIDPIIQAIQQHPKSKNDIAAFSDTTVPTLNSICSGADTVVLYNYGKLADYLGYDVEVTFKKKATEPVTV
jgi:hypothetical protein